MTFQRNILGGISADEPFWAALEQGEFRMPQCPSCKAFMWPAHYRCPCGSWEFDWVSMPLDATVYSWTRTTYPFERVSERDADLPFVTILAEIPGTGGARVMGILVGDEDKLAIGAPIRGVILPPSDKSKGYPSIGWELVGEAGG